MKRGSLEVEYLLNHTRDVAHARKPWNPLDLDASTAILSNTIPLSELQLANLRVILLVMLAPACGSEIGSLENFDPFIGADIIDLSRLRNFTGLSACGTLCSGIGAESTCSLLK